AQVGTPRPYGDGYPNGIVHGAEPHFAVADEDDRADVTGPHLVDPDRFDTGSEDFFLRERNLDSQDMRRAEEPIDVLGQAKDGRSGVTAFVAPDTLEDAEAVVQGMRQHMNLGGVPGHQLAVEPDLFRLFQESSPAKIATRWDAPSQMTGAASGLVSGLCSSWCNHVGIAGVDLVFSNPSFEVA